MYHQMNASIDRIRVYSAWFTRPIDRTPSNSRSHRCIPAQGATRTVDITAHSTSLIRHMVVLHLKSGGGGDAADGAAGGGGDAFLYETSCATPVDILIADLVRRSGQHVALGLAAHCCTGSRPNLTSPPNPLPLPTGVDMERAAAAPGARGRAALPAPAVAGAA